MKFSLQWLQEFVDLTEFFSKPEALSELLTRAGFEVESWEDLRPRYRNVVVGQVIKKDKHPQADRLTLCQVDVGDGSLRQIVCGAKNHNEKDFVVVALPGAQLPNGMKIEKSVIRQVASEGMLCSESELGLKDESEGILLLPEGAPVGSSFASYGKLDDVIFEVKVTPNRPDVLSHWGLAQELGVLLGRSVKAPAIKELKFESRGLDVPIKVEDSDFCPAYLAAQVDGIQVGDSPLWLRRRLELLGVKSINNVVDVTNYVLLELGQPLHAFDRAQIGPAGIVVRRARRGERFLALNGDTYELTETDGVIAGAKERVLALAGIIGGHESGTSLSTQSIILESAIFQSGAIRRSMRHHGLHTDASDRFSKGVAVPKATLGALRALCLLEQVLPSSISMRIYKAQEVEKRKARVEVSQAYLEERLGFAVDPTRFEQILTALGCEWVRSSGAMEWQVQAPWWRSDLEQAVDFVEEYARIVGYEHIPEVLPKGGVSVKSHDANYLWSERVKKVCRQLGYQETVHSIFTSFSQEQEFFGFAPWTMWVQTGVRSVAVKNPLSQEWSHLRTSLGYSLVQRLLHIHHHGLEEGALFEVAPISYWRDSKPEHPWHIALARLGQSQDLWNQRLQAPLMAVFQEEVKQGLKELTGLTDWRWVPVTESSLPIPSSVHHGRSAWIYREDRCVGIVAEVSPAFKKHNKLRVDLVWAEFWGLNEPQGKMGVQYQPFSRYPFVRRDLAMVLPKKQALEPVWQVCREHWGDWLVRFELFDLYEGDSVPQGHHQVGVRFVLQSSTQTLVDQEVNQKFHALIQDLQQRFGMLLPQR
jgi:phenylalanyl-tRNA synthetase beta chain